MYKKILMAYNGTHEGRIALFECAEVASFVKAETHLLAVTTPSMSMFAQGFEGTIPEQRSTQEPKLMKNVLAEGLAALTQRGYPVTGHLAVVRTGGGNLPTCIRAKVRPHGRGPQAEAFAAGTLVARLDQRQPG